ncbi:hypothetical protein BC938DRAFT_482999 [Jimgerdemannia flammicorona]|uniref:Uncharacterized protein n=1 Tax=Jimgerdemannia flammicorona TaxID=994334 RepID=A0A433QCX7_9FUNG|nr:hypothetical protein BC938DRAFT_482999 [Jimgerdemannia flammicorona]
MSTVLAIQQQQPAFFPVQHHDSHNTRTELTPPPSPKSSPSPTLSLAKLKRQEYSTSTPMLKTIYSCNVCGKQYKHRNCLVKVPVPSIRHTPLGPCCCVSALEFPDPFHHLRHPAHHSSLQTLSHPTAPLGTPRILADVLEIQRHQAPTGSDDGGRPDPCKYRLRQLMRELPNRGWGKKKKGRAQAFVQTLCSLFCVILYSGPVRTGTVLDLPNHPADDVDGTGVGLRLSPGPPIFEPFAAFLLDGAGFAR